MVLSTFPQLPLQLGRDEAATLEDFWPRPQLGALLARVRAPQQESLQFLHGGPGVGKTHLLHAACRALPGAVYLPLQTLREFPPAQVFESLERASLIAIDDLHAVAADPAWEEALFHLLNRARMSGASLWCAARQPPLDAGVSLADLASRLAGGVTWALPAYNDDEKQSILQHRAQRRGFDLPSAVARYLCHRDSRHLDDLLSTLDRLDDATLQLQRPLTVPLVKQIMGW